MTSEHVRYAGGNKELLIGVNDTQAAETLKYTYEVFSGGSKPQAPKFLQWVRQHIDQGHLIIAGWYQHKPRGDQEYDHIMPILGYRADTSGNVNGLYFQDLYLKKHILAEGNDLGSTRQASSLQNEPEQPFHYSLPRDTVYAIVITGPKDSSKGELLRTKLSVDRWHEPDWGAEDKLNQSPVEINLTATVYGLNPGEEYTILRFDDSKSVPTSGYAKGPSAAS